MNNETFEYLSTKALSNELNDEELKDFQVYLERDEYLDRFLWLKDKWNLTTKKPSPEFDYQRVLNLLQDKIANATAENLPTKSKKRNIKPTIKWLLATAATISILVTLAIFNTQNIENFLIKKDIGSINYSTGQGEKKLIQLIDGSTVQLNSDSKIKLARNFSNNRTVIFQGEAFFNVARNPDLPFRITTKDVSTVVLGTSFNIKSIEGYSDVVTVRNGRVQVESRKNKDKVFLTANEQVIAQEGNKLYVTNIDNTDKAYGWTKGILVFERASVQEIKTQIESWYGVQVQLEGSNLDSIVFTGIYDNLTLNEMMSLIQYSLNIEYSIKSNKLTIQFN